jgi:hypothetical protein
MTLVSSACSRRRRGNSHLLWTHLGQLAGGLCRATLTADLATPASTLQYAHFHPHLRLLQPQGLLSRRHRVEDTPAREEARGQQRSEAEGEGFEPPGRWASGFQDHRIKPLCHPSRWSRALSRALTSASVSEACSQTQGVISVLQVSQR